MTIEVTLAADLVWKIEADIAEQVVHRVAFNCCNILVESSRIEVLSSISATRLAFVHFLEMYRKIVITGCRYSLGSKDPLRISAALQR